MQSLTIAMDLIHRVSAACFTVLKKMDEQYAYLADPSFGNIRVSHAKFKEMFFTRDEEEKPGK